MIPPKRLLGGDTKVCYTLVRPVFSLRKRRWMEVGMVLVFFTAIVFVALGVDKFGFDIGEGKGKLIALGIMILISFIAGKLINQRINRTKELGRLELHEEGFYFTDIDKTVPYTGLGKVWYSTGLFEDYLSKRPKPQTYLVKLLTMENEILYFEVDKSARYGSGSAVSRLPEFVELLEEIKPRYGVHANKKLRKLDIHSLSNELNK